MIMFIDTGRKIIPLRKIDGSTITNGTTTHDGRNAFLLLSSWIPTEMAYKPVDGRVHVPSTFMSVDGLSNCKRTRSICMIKPESCVLVVMKWHRTDLSLKNVSFRQTNTTDCSGPSSSVNYAPLGWHLINGKIDYRWGTPAQAHQLIRQLIFPKCFEWAA